MAIVIDASVAAAWCFPQEEGSSVADAVAMWEAVQAESKTCLITAWHFAVLM